MTDYLSFIRRAAPQLSLSEQRALAVQITEDIKRAFFTGCETGIRSYGGENIHAFWEIQYLRYKDQGRVSAQAVPSKEEQPVPVPVPKTVAPHRTVRYDDSWSSDDLDRSQSESSEE